MKQVPQRGPTNLDATIENIVIRATRGPRFVNPPTYNIELLTDSTLESADLNFREAWVRKVGVLMQKGQAYVITI